MAIKKQDNEERILLARIAQRLFGVGEDDYTESELQVVKILERAGYLQKKKDHPDKEYELTGYAKRYL